MKRISEKSKTVEEDWLVGRGCDQLESLGKVSELSRPLRDSDQWIKRVPGKSTVAEEDLLF